MKILGAREVLVDELEICSTEVGLMPTNLEKRILLWVEWRID